MTTRERELILSAEEASWLEDALYELKGLRGWAWSGEDFDAYESIERQLEGGL